MNDGNAACRRRLAANLHAVLSCERCEMLDVASQKSLVGGNNVLAVLERFFEDFRCGMISADEFHDDVDFGVFDHVFPVERENAFCKAKALRFRVIAAACAFEVQVDAIVFKIFVVMGVDEACYAPADGSKADKSYVYASHANSHLWYAWRRHGGMRLRSDGVDCTELLRQDERRDRVRASILAKSPSLTIFFCLMDASAWFVLLSVVFLISACMAAALFAQIAKREGVRALVHGIMAVCGLLSILAWGGTQIALPAQIAFTVFNVVYAACARKRLRRDI